MLSYYADAFTHISVNALMYPYPEENMSADPGGDALSLNLLDNNQLALAVTFAHQVIGAPTDWPVILRT
jgi:hypothetical protein